MTYTIDDLQENIRANIDYLKAQGFEATQCGALWIVCNDTYTGYGDTEYQAWCDLVLDVEIANEIIPYPAPTSE